MSGCRDHLSAFQSRNKAGKVKRVRNNPTPQVPVRMNSNDK